MTKTRELRLLCAAALMCQLLGCSDQPPFESTPSASVTAGSDSPTASPGAATEADASPSTSEAPTPTGQDATTSTATPPTHAPATPSHTTENTPPPPTPSASPTVERTQTPDSFTTPASTEPLQTTETATPSPQPEDTPSASPEPTASHPPTPSATAPPEATESPTPPIIDDDGDGHDATADCDDHDPTIHPDAEERCDGIDNNCNRLVDLQDPAIADALIAYPDTDHDGFGAAGSASVALCQLTSGWVENTEDCDDTDSSIHPGAQEICDGLDNDCDTLTDLADDDVIGVLDVFVDADFDGYGSTLAASQPACEVGEGQSLNHDDCDDGQASVNPDAIEGCDGIDNDCDGLVDDEDDDYVDAITIYVDSDGDGYGDPELPPQVACSVEAGYAANADDCNDGDANVNPSGSEACSEGDADPADEDCDGIVDEAKATNARSWYLDEDDDGYGLSSTEEKACHRPEGYSEVAADCDDNNPSINPGADEICDAADADEDCDGLADDLDPSVSDPITYYLDYDEDGYGGAVLTTTRCDAPDGFVPNVDDCDDGNPAIHPDAQELCDAEGVDENCNGLVDDEDSNVGALLTWYFDFDEDGYGSDNHTTEACSMPEGFSADATDCDDLNAGVNPGATERCNTIDDNCNTLIDDEDTGVEGTSPWYEDRDGDGYGAEASAAVDRCVQPEGYTDDNSDCDDQPTSCGVKCSPAVAEICDGYDNDCDTLTDDDDNSLSNAPAWYVDSDGDGFGDEAATANEACEAPDGHTDNTQDCDDDNAEIRPDAEEVCNTLDDDCDGRVDDDDDVSAPTVWYADADDDGQGNLDDSIAQCSRPEGYVEDARDCDDANGDVYALANEVCNGQDDDCDDLVDDEDDSVDGDTFSTYYQDADGDGYGSTETLARCDAPDMYVATDGDCDDLDATINPDAAEVCDGVGADPRDNNCNGSQGDGDPTLDLSSASSWYPDADDDGFGDGGSLLLACEAPEGYVSDSQDCDDTQAEVHPEAVERCNDVDDDCDTLIDDADDDAEGAPQYLDADDDGYGAGAAAVYQCLTPEGHASQAGDCDDGDPQTHPDAPELANDQVDQDCDGWLYPTFLCDGIQVPGDFNTIRTAINAAQDGDVICLKQASYSESNIVINKAIRLQGISAEQTHFTQHLTLTAGAMLSGIDFQSGITITPSSGNTVRIEDSRVTTTDYNGIYWEPTNRDGARLYIDRTAVLCTWTGPYGIYAEGVGGGPDTPTAKGYLYVRSSYVGGCRSGVTAESYNSYAGSMYVYLYNNTLSKNTNGIVLDVGTQTRGSIHYYNNIVAQNTAVGIAYDNNHGGYCPQYGGHNNVWGSTQNYDGGVHASTDVNSDPKLNYGMIVPAPNPATSPVVFAGSTSKAPSFGDHWQQSWNDPPTMGAIEP